MLISLRNFHRFLVSQSLYPILLSSLLAFGIFAGRVLYSHSWNYNNLVDNLILAWVPYICSMVVIGLHQWHPGRWWLLLLPGVLWLVFFPNAPYLVTDFYHLEWRQPVPMWYDIGMLAIFAWTGCFLAIASLKSMQYIVNIYLGRIISWCFVGLTLGFSALGVYMGRFLRWNSWDLLLNPKDVLADIAVRLADPLNNLRFIGFTVMFTAILLVFYLMIISINRIEGPQK